MSQDLNYNVMFSPRGVIMLAQTEHEVRGYAHSACKRAARCGHRIYRARASKKLVPIINIHGPRYPVLGGLWQARVALRVTMRWPGAMRGPVLIWAWT
jgi:sarcosine oxidase subunit beta